MNTKLEFHGSDIEKVCEHYGLKKEDIVNFGANVNPLGLSEQVKKALATHLDLLSSYPDRSYTSLRNILSTYCQIPADFILPGNGSSELISLLIEERRPKHTMILGPTYSEYSRELGFSDSTIDCFYLKPEQDFQLSVEELCLALAKKQIDFLILCNPNNPTGQVLNPPLLKEIVERCCDNNILLAVDECFMEFLPLWKEYTAKSLVTRTTNLIVIDAFTKTYSLAGFRLGFCASGNTGLLSSMRLYGQNFAVSTPAQLAGICALMDDSYMKNTYHILSEEREWLAAELGKLPLEVYPSQGNFLLLRAVDKNIRQMLFDQGIKVRDCSRFYGLNSEYCRIAIRAHDDNRKLIKALSNIFS